MQTKEIVSRPRLPFAPQSDPFPLSSTGMLLLPLVTGGLLWLCYFPFNLGWLCWVALVPLLTLVRSQARPWMIYLSAWAGGLVYFWPALQWLRVADDRMYFTWAFLTTYCALYFPLALYLIRLLDRCTRIPFVVTVPVVWTALEFFRSFFGTGFSWYLLAHTQHDWLPVIQIADISGAWGVSFLIAAVNALCCEVVLAWFGRPLTTRGGLLLHGVALAVVFAGALGYGIWRLGQTEFEPGPRIALLQGNLPQQIRNNPSTQRSVWDHYTALSDVAALAKADLIVWPETSMPCEWEEVWPTGPTPDTHDLCREVARRYQTSVLLGLNSTIIGSDRAGRRYNSAVLVNARGEAVARYDKIHRVPFGEYVPLRDWFPFMNWFAPYDFDYSVSAGAGATRFPAAPPDFEHVPLTFGVVICYEDTDPDTTRPYGGGDGRSPAGFLLNISNDGWFDGTSEHAEHLAICRFRAIECRRSVARAVNMGISALIDSNGRVLAPRQNGEQEVPSGVGPENVSAAIWDVGPASPSLAPNDWAKYKKVSGILLATIPLDTRTSFYAGFGDWLPWSCWAMLLTGFVVIVRSTRFNHVH